MAEQKTKTTKNLFANLSYLIKKSYGYDKKLFGMFAAQSVAETVIAVLGVSLVKLLVDELTTQKRTYYIIGIIGVAAVTLLLCDLVISHCNSKKWYRLVMIRLKFLVVRGKKIMGMNFEDTENPRVLDMFQKSKMAVNDYISADNQGIEGYLDILYMQGSKLFNLFSYIAILVTFNPLVALLIFLSVLLEYYLNLKLADYEHKMYDKVSPIWRKLDYYEERMCDAKFSKDIRIYRISGFLLKRFVILGNQSASLLNGFANKTLTVNLLSVIINVVRYGALNIYLFYCVKNKGLSIGDYSMYLATTTAFSVVVTTMMVSFADLIKKNLFINDYINFMKLPDKSNKTDRVDYSKGFDIEFKNVTFAYPNSDKNVLENFSLHIKQGQKLALVGINGCGKTTLIKVLTGLYTPKSGEILLSGVPITNFNPRDYYDIFSVVFQDINMFAWTIAENVALAEYSEIDFDKLEEALRLSGLLEKVNSLADGYNSNMLKVLDENGIELSGGQAQKLALARALYKTSQIIILDEPTAALDPIAEHEIYQGFDRLIQDKTAIYVSHRLSSTRFCDVIAYFEDGKIVEYGTHDELMGLGQRYADMFSKQAYYYQEEGVSL